MAYLGPEIILIRLSSLALPTPVSVKFSENYSKKIDVFGGGSNSDFVIMFVTNYTLRYNLL